MRKRRIRHRAPVGRTARIAVSLLVWLFVKVARRPVDSCALLAALTASLAIIVNAVFLQSESRSGSLFANPPAPLSWTMQTSPLSGASAHAPSAGRGPAARPVAPRRKDPITELIAVSSRIREVQRALSEYGYGQIKPTGILDQPTSAAIETFERAHKMPITGRVSMRLVSELAAMTGHPLQ